VAGELSAIAKTNLTMIISSGKRLANLVNDILEWSYTSVNMNQQRVNQ
jgi:hypothetical protein